ncbi:MAG: hypothetical protein K2N48_05495 [Muribaculaceae bacterium]|nr:hypothetical protein [Muribaculaceae bacterium]
MYNKIYVFSPTSQATGGTELLQQLTAKLRVLGQNAFMVYTTSYDGSPVQKVFGPRYKNPYVTEIEDAKDNIMIVSEAAMYLLLNYKYIHKSVWWLSVDFYGGSFKLPTDRLHKIFYKISDKIYSSFDKKWIHFVQSEYAYNYCLNERNIPVSQIFRLSDYLSKDFIQNGREKDKETKKEDNILYNPKKGIEFTKKLIAIAPSLNWIPIQNMTAKEVSELMNKSKVYIDFGNHPGKDRIPREAAICGCCVITGLRGSANNDIDIPIPSAYKFSEKDPKEIINMIELILDDYSNKRSDYEKYIEKILKEEIVFENEVIDFFTKDRRKETKIKQCFSTEIKRKILKPIIYSMKFGPTLFRK